MHISGLSLINIYAGTLVSTGGESSHRDTMVTDSSPVVHPPLYVSQYTTKTKSKTGIYSYNVLQLTIFVCIMHTLDS